MVVRLEFVGEGWPGSDQAHFTTRDMEELRNFIERVSPQPAAHTRHSVVVDELVDRLAVPIAVTGFRFLAIKHLPFFFSSRRRHTRFDCDWSSDVCSSD